MSDDFVKYLSGSFNDNVFFCEGCQHILAKQKGEQYVFIQFEALFIRRILRVDFSVYSGVKFILISDKVMIPLALYLMGVSDNIDAVFEKKMKIKHILKAINSNAEMKKLMKETKRNNHILTTREFNFLKTYCHMPDSVSCLAAGLGVNEKSIYNCRRAVAKKLGIKKIEFLVHLLSSE